MSMRWYVPGAGNRVLIVDIEDDPDGLSRDDLFRSGTEIVESFVFSSSWSSIRSQIRSGG